MKKILVLLLLLLTISSCGVNKQEGNKFESTKNNKKVEVKKINDNNKNEKKDFKEIKPKSFDEQVMFDAYSSFNIKEMEEKVKKMKDSPEKLFVLTKLNKFEEAKKLNKKLISKSDVDHKLKLSFILKDMDGSTISDAKVKNLLTGEEIISDKNGKGIFSDDFVFPAKIPVYIEKKGYSSYAYTYNLGYSDKGKKIKNEIINLKKAESKIIDYSGDETVISFDKNAEIILGKDSVIIENTNKKYKGKINVEFTGYSKKEILANKTLRESLENAVLNGEDIVSLETFGMIDVNLYGENGEKLNINKKAIIKIPVSDIERAKKNFNIKQTGKTKNGFWYLDKKTASWVNLEDGILDLENNLYIAKVTHFSNYNFDGAMRWEWKGPYYSTTKPIVKNGTNKVVATIELNITKILNNYYINENNYSSKNKKYTHNFYNNGTWQAPKECVDECDTTPPIAEVTWFYDDTTPPNISFSCDNNSYNVDGEVKCTITGNNTNIQSPETIKVSGTTKDGKLPKFSDLKYTDDSLVCEKYKEHSLYFIHWTTCSEYKKPSQTYSFSDNGTYNITGKIVDDAGNSSKVITKTFKIDTSKPSIITNENFDKWYNESGLKDLIFSVKDQKSSTNDNEESGLESISATFNGNSIGIDGFEKTTGTETIDVTIKKDDLSEYIEEKSTNKLIIKAVDKVGHSFSLTKYIKYDITKPELDVSNKNYNWSNEIKIKLYKKDQTGLSGLSYAKYIWDDKNKCVSDGIDYENEKEIELSEEGQHTLYLCAEDNAGNNIITEFGKYKLDVTPPELDVSNKNGYTTGDWSNEIKIILKTSDTGTGSGIDFSKYIWDNASESACFSSTNTFVNDQEITLDMEGEHTLYLCNQDNAGNKQTAHFGPYKLDKTNPTIENELSSIISSVLAGENNFKVKLKVFDNLNQTENQTNSLDEEIKYSYKITADQAKEKLNKTINSGNEINDLYSLTDASENLEKFKFEIDLEDKAGNTKHYEKDFVVYPTIDNGYKFEIKSVSSNGDKYANNSDFYKYEILLKDKYNNPIYNKQIQSLFQTGTKTIYLNEIIKSGEKAFIYSPETPITNDNGIITFDLKSYTPGEFSQKFHIKLKKWNNSYNDISSYLEKDTEYFTPENNKFLQPLKPEISTESNEVPQLGKDLKYNIELKNNGNVIYSDGKLELTTNTLKLIDGHIFRGNINIIKNTGLDSNTNDTASFSGIIDANFNVLKAPKLTLSGAKIEYTTGGKTVKYILQNSDELGGGCDLDTLGVKVKGTLQGGGKSSLTGQDKNISDLSKGDLRGKIRANAYKTIKNMPTEENINGILYYNGGNIKYSDVKGHLAENETVIVKNGNFVIDEDIDTNIGIIVLKDNYNISTDYNKLGNVYVKDTVEKINAIIYADGTFRSANAGGVGYTDDKLGKQLKINGSLFTRNTIGGAVLGSSGKYILPGGQITTDFDKAEKYDLNYVRKVTPICSGTTQDPNSYSLVITYNPQVQTNPPKVFGK